MGTLSNVFGKKNLTPDEQRLQAMIDKACKNSPTAKATIEKALANGMKLKWDTDGCRKINAIGYCIQSDKTVALSADYSEATLISTIIHEARHANQPAEPDAKSHDMRTIIQWNRAIEADAMTTQALAAYEMRGTNPEVWDDFKSHFSFVATPFEEEMKRSGNANNARQAGFAGWMNSGSYKGGYDESEAKYIRKLMRLRPDQTNQMSRRALSTQEIEDRINSVDNSGYLRRNTMQSPEAMALSLRDMYELKQGLKGLEGVAYNDKSIDWANGRFRNTKMVKVQRKERGFFEKIGDKIEQAVDDVQIAVGLKDRPKTKDEQRLDLLLNNMSKASPEFKEQLKLAKADGLKIEVKASDDEFAEWSSFDRKTNTLTLDANMTNQEMMRALMNRTAWSAQPEAPSIGEADMRTSLQYYRAQNADALASQACMAEQMRKDYPELADSFNKDYPDIAQAYANAADKNGISTEGKEAAFKAWFDNSARVRSSDTAVLNTDNSEWAKDNKDKVLTKAMTAEEIQNRVAFYVSGNFMASDKAMAIDAETMSRAKNEAARYEAISGNTDHSLDTENGKLADTQTVKKEQKPWYKRALDSIHREVRLLRMNRVDRKAYLAAEKRRNEATKRIEPKQSLQDKLKTFQRNTVAPQTKQATARQDFNKQLQQVRINRAIASR